MARLPSIRVKPIVPKKMRVDLFKFACSEALKEEAVETIKLYRRVSDKFQSGPVPYRVQGPRWMLRGYGISISTRDKRMVYLDRGTKVRHALMSNPYKPKTTPNLLSARKGKGYRVAVSRSIQQPGIKARNWTAIVVKLREPRFKKQLQRKIRLASKGLFTP